MKTSHKMVIQRIEIATLPLLQHCVRRIQLQQKLGAAHKLSGQKMYISACNLFPTLPLYSSLFMDGVAGVRSI